AGVFLQFRIGSVPGAEFADGARDFSRGSAAGGEEIVGGRLERLFFAGAPPRNGNGPSSFWLKHSRSTRNSQCGLAPLIAIERSRWHCYSEDIVVMTTRKIQ